jgi:ribosomal protein L29
MKKNDIVDMRSKTVDELNRIVADLRSDVDKNRTDEALRKMKNTNLVRSKRKDLARALTFLHIKNLAAEADVQKTEVAAKEEIS